MYNQIDSNKRRTWLLIVVFTVIILLIGWFIGYYFNYGYGALVIAAVFSVIMSLFSYYGGDQVALRSAKAQEIKEEDNTYVYHLVENLCITAGVPVPKIYLLPEQAINAFATGRDPRHASVALTAGAINKLSKLELEGVIAHELSHVKNYDIRLMTIVIVLVGLISILADWFLRGSLLGRGDNNDRGNPALLIVGVVLILLSPIVAQLIKLAVSRRREYLADASGALLTRYPEGLADALEKISGDQSAMSSASSATAHLYIANPFKNSSRFLSNAFSTHPPIEDRIKKLKEMTV
ncbi:MAG: M48 family metallopeptidase [Candidatus Buchananbacteria bacterium]